MSSFNLIKSITLPQGIGSTPKLDSNDCFLQTSGLYKWYQVMIIGVRPSKDNAYLAMQYYFNQDGYPESGNEYNITGYCNDSASNRFWHYSQREYIPFFDNYNFTGSHSSTEVNGIIRIYHPSSPNVEKSIDFQCNAPDAYNNNMLISSGASSYKANKSPITGVSFFFITSNGEQNKIDISGGQINIYGINDLA